MPYLSPLKAVGLTCKAFAFHIKRELEKNYFSMFTVIVKFTYKPKFGSMEALDNQRRLKSENIVSIRILEDKREALQQVVAVTGEIQVPYLGLLKAEGLTCRELALQIKAGLEKEFFKVATVLVTKDEDVTPRLVKCFLQPPTVVLFGDGKADRYIRPPNRQRPDSEWPPRESWWAHFRRSSAKDPDCPQDSLGQQNNSC